MNQQSHIPLPEAAHTVARHLQRAPLAQVWITCIMLCIDIPLFTATLWFAQYAGLPVATFQPALGAGLAALGGVFACILLTLSRSYATDVLRDAKGAVIRGLLALTLPAVCATYLLDPATLHSVLPAVLLAASLAIIPSRIGTSVAARWVTEAGLTQRRAIIAGGGDHAAQLIRGLAERSDSDIHLFGLFDDREEARSPLQVLGIPKIGGYDDLITFVRKTEVDLVIVALPLDAEDRITWLLQALRVLPVEVRLSAYSADYAFQTTRSDALISALSRSFAPERRLTKRLFDIAVASLAIVILSPLMLATAIAIRLDSPGPVLFRQARHGYNDRVIQVLKFRSMYADQADDTARQVVTRNDPRVTRVGRILRRSSIDELPQLFNVLRGDLSLVGPRPHAVDALSSGQQRFTSIVDGYSARHRLPPGITGWAQINGWRGEIDDPVKLQARFEHDLYYIENWSLWLDLRILWRTPRSLLRSEGAY